ncbi:coenzyme PQQ biosynthesis protein C [Paraburkholderia sp. WC7.3g]
MAGGSLLLAHGDVRAADSSRPAGWPDRYPWIDAQGLQYFRSRIPLAQRDVEHGLDVTLNHFRTPDAQQRALDILRFKLDILWSTLDAIDIEKAYPL